MVLRTLNEFSRKKPNCFAETKSGGQKICVVLSLSKHGVREWPVRRLDIYFLEFFGTFCFKTKRTTEKITTNELFIYVLMLSYIDTQYVIVQKGWTNHIVSRRKFWTSYRHLSLQYYEIILWTIS